MKNEMINSLKLLLKRIKFLNDFRKFKRLEKEQIHPRFLFKKSDIIPCLFDDTKNTSFDRHYIYHPAWASRVLSKIRPKNILIFHQQSIFVLFYPHLFQQNFMIIGLSI